MKPHAIVLRIQVNSEADLPYLSDALGECARELEAHESNERLPVLGLVPDLDDPGRFAWEIAVEAYPPL